MKKFILQNWKSFMVSLFASLLSALLVATLLIWVFRIPNFDFHIEHVVESSLPITSGESAIVFKVFNKKYFLGFEKESVTFRIFIPAEMFENKKYYVHTTKGSQKVIMDELTKGDNYLIDGVEYTSFRSEVHYFLKPRTTERVISIIGNFSHDLSGKKVCMYFNSLNGTDPRFLKYRNNVDGNINVNINDLKCKTIQLKTE